MNNETRQLLERCKTPVSIELRHSIFFLENTAFTESERALAQYEVDNLKSLKADIEAELVKPEQDPIGYIGGEEDNGANSFVDAYFVKVTNGQFPFKNPIAVYTSPPAREPLTDDEAGYLLGALRAIATGVYEVWSNGAQAQRTAIAAIEKYEAAHGIGAKP